MFIYKCVLTICSKFPSCIINHQSNVIKTYCDNAEKKVNICKIPPGFFTKYTFYLHFAL